MNKGAAKELLDSFICISQDYDPSFDATALCSVRAFEERERRALVEIYEACGGENWTRNHRWLKTREPHTWHGVNIEDGHVVHLNLRNNNLTGTLPDCFASLPKLRVVYLPQNNLTGAIPPSIGGLSDCVTLDLSCNALSGSVPRSLGGLFRLQRLLLDHNQLEADLPNTLACLTNLKWVDFRENREPEKPLPSCLDFIPVRRPQDTANF